MYLLEEGSETEQNGSETFFVFQSMPEYSQNCSRVRTFPIKNGCTSRKKSRGTCLASTRPSKNLRRKIALQRGVRSFQIQNLMQTFWSLSRLLKLDVNTKSSGKPTTSQFQNKLSNIEKKSRQIRFKNRAEPAIQGFSSLMKRIKREKPKKAKVSPIFKQIINFANQQT